MKSNVIMFIEFFTMYSQIFVIWNNHEYSVLMNSNFKNVENQNMNSECMHMKCKFVVTIMWNILQELNSSLLDDNNAIVPNDQNDTFSEAFIDVYILEVYNLKNCIYSQPHGCY
jgi:hypothetical protein